MSLPRPTLDQTRAAAFKLAVFATVGTILITCVGGFHYLSTTNNLSQPGSLAVLRYVGYTLVIALVATGVGVVCSVWSELDTKRSRRASRENDDRPSTMDIIKERNKRY